MGRYYRSKKAGRGRGWFRRNLGRAGSALKKRYMSGGKLSLAKVASDAKYALSIAKTARGLLNTEKKRYEFNAYSQLLGQVSNNSNGSWSMEITPTVSTGTGHGNRIGSSICLRSSFIKIQAYQQSSTTQRIFGKIMVVEARNGDAFDITTFSQYNKYLYALNTVGIYDTHCERDPDYYNNFRVIRTVRFSVAPDQFSGVANAKDITIKLNFGKNGKHVRFENSSNTPTNSRFYLVGVVDCGNCGASASTLAGLSVTAASTGLSLQIDGCHYFIDN